MSAKPSTPPVTIKAGEFKARCLDLMDQVAASGHAIVITKRGRPVAKLVPALAPPASVFGFAKGSLEITGDVVLGLERDYPVREDRIALLAEVPLPRGGRRPRKISRR